MDGRIKSRTNSAAIKSKIYEPEREFAKFGVLNLPSNLKDEIVKFKKANLTLSPPNSPLFFKNFADRSNFALKFDGSELVLLRSHMLGGRYFRQSRHQHS